MLPRPIADPAIAITAVAPLPKCSLPFAIAYKMKLVTKIDRTQIGATHLIRK